MVKASDRYQQELIALNLEIKDQQQRAKNLLYKEGVLKKAFKTKTAPWQDKLEDKVPEKLEATLKSAFKTAFKMVFQEGAAVIEKTYSDEALKQEYANKRAQIQGDGRRSVIQSLREKGRKRYFSTLGVTTAEGVGLGLLGIGLPDVPLLIGNMIRTANVSAKSHGLDPDRRDEQYYTLLLIRLVAAPQDERAAVEAQLDALAEQIDSGEAVPIALDEEIQQTADALATAMLVSRFVMGLPIVGVAGGLYNSVIISQLHQLAEVKYEVRLLKRCRATLVRQHQQTKGSDEK
ncbi:MAG: EcsC family protein [Peptococcaceae bacterium]|nr:EcsC family protein [Peptococcaceae bacterium]